MRFRAIIREDDAAMAANVGGAVETAWRTVEFDCPELARLMGAAVGTYGSRQIVGVEIIQSLEQGGQS